MNSQPGYYSGPAIMNAPPTPFDTAYGVTLLPSHLLMGSPFVSSPDLFQQAHQQQAHHRQPYKPYKMTPSSNRSMSKIVNSYPPPPTLNAAPPSRSAMNSRRNSHYQLIQGSANSELFQEPFMITYTVLPKGNDEYRTRSLLFQNVNNSVDLHSFVNKYSKFGPVESVYLFKGHNEDEKNSILLSFLSRKVCLDFYNSVLQRLSEFKTSLDSKSLTLSFVSLKYRMQDESNGNEEKNEDTAKHTNETETDSLDDAFNVTTAASLHYDIVNRGATRSIVLSLKNSCTKDELFEKKLQFLDAEKKENKRYVLESVDLINSKEPTKHFPQNYAILTLLNISMAVELLDYVRSNAKKLGFEKCFFVSILPQKTERSMSNLSSAPANGNLNETVNSNYKNKNASLSSLDSAGSLISLDQEIESISIKLQGIQLDKHSIEISPNTYPKPFFADHSDHLPNVNISEAASLDFQFSEPNSRDIPLNEVVLPTREQEIDTDVSFTHGDQRRQSLNSQILPMQSQMPLESMNSVYYMDQSNPRQNSMTKPITQSLQRQYATSAEVASLMGGGVGNRTVYIGNIHPRSKPEDICNVVRGGILQNIKFLKEKHICFVTFIEASTAVQFYTNAFIDPIVLHGNMLKVGWGHHSGPLPKSISLAVTVGASRNVYVSLPEYSFKDKYINDPQYQEYLERYKIPTEQQLREDFNPYGDIEQVNYLSDGHCCWVNFMNISAATRLVEEFKNDDGEKFHSKFNNRYKGLIIGYGKDRCGNVNKNLIAGKNSRFYKKVKKPSYNIRLNKMEEERRLNEEALRKQHENNSEQALQFNSLGITLEGGGQNNKQTDNNEGVTECKEAVEQHISEDSDQEGEELLKLSNESALLSGLGLCDPEHQTRSSKDPAEETSTFKDLEEASDKSDASTDIELIIHTPVEEKDGSDAQAPENLKKHEIGGKFEDSSGSISVNERHPPPFYDVASVVSNPLLEVNPPMAPATISRNYSMMVRNQNRYSRPSHYNGQNQGHSQFPPLEYQNNVSRQNKTNRPRKNSKKRNTKTIPGSDVMAQYLAQLQHSTFMYAANILGASSDGDGNYYDEGTN